MFNASKRTRLARPATTPAVRAMGADRAGVARQKAGALSNKPPRPE
jgi:hypothetical protein